MNTDEDEDSVPPSPMTMQDGIRAVQQAFAGAATPPRWPMYVRQAKQFLRNAIEGFDERKYGFASVVDLLRAAGKEGVLRLERDRQGAVRLFPGAKLAERPAPQAHGMTDIEDAEETVDGNAVDAVVSDTVDAYAIEEVNGNVAEPGQYVVAESITEEPIVDAEPIDNEAQPVEAEAPKRSASRKRAAAPRAAKGTKAKAAKPAAARKTKGTRSR